MGILHPYTRRISAAAFLLTIGATTQTFITEPTAPNGHDKRRLLNKIRITTAGIEIICGAGKSELHCQESMQWNGLQTGTITSTQAQPKATAWLRCMPNSKVLLSW